MTALEIALVAAVKAARSVQRPPKGKLKVGDKVEVVGPSRGTATVESVGRTWITVSGSKLRFRIDTWRTVMGYGTGYSLRTIEQRDYDRRLAEAKEAMRTAGIAVSSVAPPPDGHILAMAALVRVLDERKVKVTPIDPDWLDMEHRAEQMDRLNGLDN